MALAIDVTSKEQTLLVDRWVVQLRFNPLQQFWFYDLYDGDTLLLAGQKLELNSYPIALETLHYPKLFLVDTDPTNPEPINMETDLGDRLELCETDYQEAV